MGSPVLKKLAVLTSGGDSPAMNAAIYGFLSRASDSGAEVYGVIDGYRGFVNGNYRLLNARDFKKYVYQSGTAIGSSRCLEFKDPSVRQKAVDSFHIDGFDALFVIGGDGSYMGASLISQLGCKVVAAPGTIDNDVASSHYTIGYFSALEEIFQGIKKIRATSESHSQITFIEVMGRHCHDLTVAASLSGVVDYVITNSSPKKPEELEIIVKDMIASGKRGIVVLVTEKVYGPDYDFGLPSLGDLCKQLEKSVGRQVRFNVLGYVQRGAIPVSWDLYVAQRFGIKAFELMQHGKFGHAIGFNGHDFYETPLVDAVNMKKTSNTPVIDFVNSSYKI